MLTAVYERTLKEIEQGRATVADFLGGQAEFVRAKVREANAGAAALAGSEAPACPACGEGRLRRIKRKDGGHFWGCNRYQEGCKFSCDDRDGKPVLTRESPAPSALHQCLSCGKGLVRRPGKQKGTFWWGCSGFPECKQTYPDIKGKPDYGRK